MDDWLGGKQAFERNNAKPVREQALNLIERAGFLESPEKLHAQLRNTSIHLSDGTAISYEVEPSHLSLVHTELDGDTDIDIVTMSPSEGDGESYYPTNMLRLIDLPLIQLETGLAELEED